MKRCDRCSLDYTGDLDRCPLCGTTLAGEPTPSPFPTLDFQRASTRARGVLLAVSLAAAALAVAAGAAAGASALLIVAIVAAIVLNWLFVRNVMVHAPDFLRLVERYFLVLTALMLLWFLGTGSSFVATFAIPGSCLLAITFDAVLVIAYRGTFVTTYAKYLVFDIALGLVPAAFLATGQVTWPYLAWASIVAAVLFLAALLLFSRGRMTAETRKLFSVK